MARYQFIGVCHYCKKLGKRTELDAEWMRLQGKLISPGHPLACRDHLLEQQQDLREGEAKLREALRKRG